MSLNRNEVIDELNILDPYLPKDSILIPAWLGLLRYVLGNPIMMDAFRADTGNQWTPGKTSLDQMIDEATGADREFIVQFAAWVNANLWGETAVHLAITIAEEVDVDLMTGEP